MHLTEKHYLLWLANISGVGIVGTTKLLSFFKSAENIYKATYDTTLDLGIPLQLLTYIIEAKAICPSHYTTRLAEVGVDFLTLACDNYPEPLRHIDKPPLVLYIKGKLPASEHAVAIVGSRKASEYGIRQTLGLAKSLASQGIVIVSGMAKGIDSYAHKGAIEGGGQTIAVLGSGVDHCYPPENRALFEQIPQHGCLISEYFPGTKPTPGSFPMRNRIISGLSQGVIVTEATLGSGSLITADRALDQGRTVFALPGNVTSQLSSGTNNLIQQGACLITSATDVLEELGIETLPPEDTNEEKNLAEDEKLVYDGITLEPITFDALLNNLKRTTRPNLNLQTLTLSLTLLEINQHIEKLPGGRYVRRTT